MKTNPDFQLDEWDCKIITHLKRGAETYAGLLDIWRERCALPADYPEHRIVRGIVDHWLPLCDKDKLALISIADFQEMLAPANSWKIGWKDRMICPETEYWIRVLGVISSALTQAEVKNLPGYKVS